MQAATGSSSAVLVLAVLMFASQLPLAGLVPVNPVLAECRFPFERVARGSHTAAVGCNLTPARAAPLRGPARILFGLTLDLNRADQPTLEVLPGIGPVRARAIMAERSRRRFASVAELTRVRGIGPVTLSRLSRWVSVEPLQQSR